MKEKDLHKQRQRYLFYSFAIAFGVVVITTLSVLGRYISNNVVDNGFNLPKDVRIDEIFPETFSECVRKSNSIVFNTKPRQCFLSNGRVFVDEKTDPNTYKEELGPETTGIQIVSVAKKGEDQFLRLSVYILHPDNVDPYTPRQQTGYYKNNGFEFSETEPDVLEWQEIYREPIMLEDRKLPWKVNRTISSFTYTPVTNNYVFVIDRDDSLQDYSYQIQERVVYIHKNKTNQNEKIYTFPSKNGTVPSFPVIRAISKDGRYVFAQVDVCINCGGGGPPPYAFFIDVNSGRSLYLKTAMLNLEWLEGNNYRYKPCVIEKPVDGPSACKAWGDLPFKYGSF